jgi:hypothetical protein
MYSNPGEMKTERRNKVEQKTNAAQSIISTHAAKETEKMNSRQTGISKTRKQGHKSLE